MTQILKEFGISIDEVHLDDINEQIETLCSVYSELKRNIQTLRLNQVANANVFHDHPEIFLSSTETKTISFVKFSAGKFGKVNLKLIFSRFLI